ncbi:M3 family metallopeptidase [Streptacidiphilus carbonis]|uniref:M3 family metallopeptidase n=1 Tax=Streptacidiphilus carbonis TaxID=105422 RepID=UPI0005AA249D|nr:M3 family metallopeptidase [Streptacidiphilus carbonis]
MIPGLPDYSGLTPELLDEACRAAVTACDAGVAAIVAVPASQRTYANTMLALEDAEQSLAAAISAWTFMAQVAVDESLRDAAQEWEERLGKHRVGLGFDEELHRAVTEFAVSAEAAALTGEDARLLEHTLRDYRRNGFELSAGERRRLRGLFDELVGLGSRYVEALATWEDAIEVDREELDGLPDSFIDGLETVDGRYRVSLEPPEFQPFMANARSSERRRELMGKDFRKGGSENVARLERALAARAEIARTLGYDSWADYAVEPRMARTREAAAAFVDDLHARVAAKAEKDLVLLADANEAAVGTRELHRWDHSFAVNQLKRTAFAVDALEVAAYFPLDACLDGLFTLVQELFAVRFHELPDAPVWHPDVRAYAITDAQDAIDAEPLGYFFVDLFSRRGKDGHPTCYTLRAGRSLADGGYQRPVAAITAGFGRPTADRPSLLRHSEVVGLFHEFGHVLHGTLTRVQRARFSGSETEVDFVEAPAQMLEHWCWDPAVLRRFARHHESGEALPEQLLAGMVAAKNVDSGLATMRQLYFSALDLAYHSPGFDGDSTAVLKEVSERYGFTHLEGTHFQSRFSHLFGYEAGYYGYLWSQTLGDDMYTRFTEAGPTEAGTTDPGPGLAFRRTVLERGGTVDGDQLVRDFLGRAPNHDAYLRGLGGL